MYTLHAWVNGYLLYKSNKVSVVQTCFFILSSTKSRCPFCMSAFGDDEYPLSNKGQLITNNGLSERHKDKRLQLFRQHVHLSLKEPNLSFENIKQKTDLYEIYALTSFLTLA